ncbi:THUMP domain-containing class I SAM-dependent RNA methyltransferase [Marinigracilibium pacificum]|uniref:Class I SAM-dependent RNA methyltransferase n=1 Tax=Marinigracilibium pacificum TaxID=2729599 RepID=A0A848J0V7_9BACT|nr:class I SAM-dependent RNA methyltransferase [Marinigracilibium pacificum]NMM50197.1 class I SAM-dependent RNA methyltransferase [Marinigracilibium pacificum]
MNHNIFVSSLPGQADYLEKEIIDLGYDVTKKSFFGINIRGSFNDCVKLNLWLRTANKVLFELKSFHAPNAEKLYREVYNYPWHEVLIEDGYFTVDSYVKNDSINDKRFAQVKLKDAIVDRIRKEKNVRPDTGPERDDAAVYLHWSENKAVIYLDTSGQTIAKHGYRLHPWKAPLMEALATSIIMGTEWTPDQLFVNPMCGSGTLAIEAALMAINKRPGLIRSNYGFMHTHLFDPEYYKEEMHNLKNAILPGDDVRIVAGDIDPKAVSIAKKNANAAGVDHLIDFHTGDFKTTPLRDSSGVIVLNPDYGIRLSEGETENLELLYQNIGDFFKNEATGYTGYVFTGNLSLLKRVGLRTSSRKTYFNGKLECRLAEYPLYKGSKKN